MAQIKIKREVFKVKRAGGQAGVGVSTDVDQKKWFSELAVSRGFMVKDAGDHVTYHNPMEIQVAAHEVKEGDTFLSLKDDKPVSEIATLEIDEDKMLPTDVRV